MYCYYEFETIGMGQQLPPPHLAHMGVASQSGIGCRHIIMKLVLTIVSVTLGKVSTQVFEGSVNNTKFMASTVVSMPLADTEYWLKCSV